MTTVQLDISIYKKFFMLIVACSFSLHVLAQQFSKEDVLFDLEYLKSTLEKTHIDLYAYTTKKAFDANFKNIRSQIGADDYNLLEVINLFQKVVSNANNGHTRIGFPVQPYLEFAESGGQIFPIEVALEQGKVLIRKNWSVNSALKIGTEIKAINGLPINEILEKIYPHISAERIYFKNAQLEAFTLPRYYWQVYGEHSEFEVQVVQDGRLSTYNLKAIKALEDYEMKRDDILQQDWDFKYLTNLAAYLRPGKFSGDENKYHSFIDSVFIDLKDKKPTSLVIDLRNNPGGDDAFSDYLVSFIADTPFKWYSRFELKSSAILKEDVRKTKDTTNVYWASVLTHKAGEIYEYDFGFQKPQSFDKRFHGTVYVLVNRQSYSQATVTASQIQDYGLGQIIGEETGEFPNLYASIFTYKLPKTGIKVDVSKGKIQRVSGIDNKRGVLPDIVIKDFLLDEKDEILEEVQRIILNN